MKKKTTGTSSKRSESERGGMGRDCIDVLTEQHRQVEDLIARFESAEDNDAEGRQLARLICDKLTTHATIEEEIFYPSARESGSEDEVRQALEEHLSIKRCVADVQQFEDSYEQLRAKMKVLKEQVEHHFEQEEEEILPEVEQSITKEERQWLGQQLLERTRELDKKASDDGHRPQPPSAPAPGKQHRGSPRDVRH